MAEGRKNWADWSRHWSFQLPLRRQIYQLDAKLHVCLTDEAYRRPCAPCENFDYFVFLWRSCSPAWSRRANWRRNLVVCKSIPNQNNGKPEFLLSFSLTFWKQTATHGQSFLANFSPTSRSLRPRPKNGATAANNSNAVTLKIGRKAGKPTLGYFLPSKKVT